MSFMRMSIKNKLIVIVMTATLFSLLTMAAALLALDRHSVRSFMHEKFTSLAEIIANNSTAALTFNDVKSARVILQSLKTTEEVRLACIYDANHVGFSEFIGNAVHRCPEIDSKSETEFREDYLHVYHSVVLDHEIIGTVYLLVSMHELNIRFLQMAGIAVFLVLITGVFAYFIAHRQQKIISIPILNLARTAKEISQKGNYDIRLIQPSWDEIGELYVAFNGMMEQIKKREEDRDREVALRKESESRVRMLLESTAEAIFGVDSAGRCIFVNPSCLKILGYQNMEQLIGQSMFNIFQYNENKIENTKLPKQSTEIMEVISTGVGFHNSDGKIKNNVGDYKSVEYWIYPIKSEKNEVIGAVITFSDITARKEVETKLKNYQDHLEDLVENRTVELKNAYKELEAFSYSVSHDLRAPLRAIDGFSQALAEDYHKNLDDAGRNYLSRVRVAAQRMAQLIDDLLVLSRAMRFEMVRQDIDLSYEVREIIDQLLESDPSRKVELEIEDGIQANGDPTLVRIAIQNLVGNAWKYTSKKSKARIKFGRTLQKGETVYFVEDNGAGFDMRYANKLFHAFQRLHLPEEFPGNGIGLATVHRVIRRHGGKIWAESEVQKGTRFYFTIPPMTVLAQKTQLNK